MFNKRSQKQVSEGSQHWYQDKYQHVLTQRNVLALIAVVALIAAMLAVFTVMRLAPLKSVEPYLLLINDKTGITQRVDPVTRAEYGASEAVDRYFVSTYLRVRETYNFSILNYNYNIVRLMSTPDVFYSFRRQIDVSNPASLAATLSSVGQRNIKVKSISYITNPVPPGRRNVEQPTGKLMQARISTIDTIPNQAENEQHWVVTVGFEYANLNINEAEQLINPLGFTVTSYQIQREIN